MAFNLIEFIRTHRTASARASLLCGVLFIIVGVFAPYIVCMVLLSLAAMCFLACLFISPAKKAEVKTEVVEESRESVIQTQQEIKEPPPSQPKKAAELSVMRLLPESFPVEVETAGLEVSLPGPSFLGLKREEKTEEAFQFFSGLQPLEVLLEKQLGFLSEKEAIASLPGFTFLYKENKGIKKYEEEKLSRYNVDLIIKMILEGTRKVESKSELKSTSYKRLPYQPLLLRVLGKETMPVPERIELAKKLLKNKRELACINRLDKKGRSALWYACQWKESRKFAKYLISIGADMEQCSIVSDSDGESVFQNIFEIWGTDEEESKNIRKKYQQAYFSLPDNDFWDNIRRSHKDPYLLMAYLIDNVPAKFWNIRIVSRYSKKTSTFILKIIQIFKGEERYNLVKKLLSTAVIDLDMEASLLSVVGYFPVIYYAIFEKDVELVKLLLEGGADPNKTEWLREDKSMLSPLLFVINESFEESDNYRKENVEIMDYLVQFGADLVGCMSYLEKSGESKSRTKKNYELKKAFLEILVKNVSSENIDRLIDGKSLLHWAVTWGHLDLVTTLVEEKKANVNLPAENSLDTPLHIAAHINHADIYDFLYQHRANADAVNGKGKRPDELFPVSTKFVRFFKGPATSLPRRTTVQESKSRNILNLKQ